MYGYVNHKTNETIVSDEPDSSRDFTETDENLVFAVSALEKLGYTVTSCGEGHWERIKGNNGCMEIADVPYISFADGVKLPSAPAGWDSEVENECEDYETGKMIPGYFETIRVMDMLSIDRPEDYYLAKMEALKHLYEWIRAFGDSGKANRN